MNKSRKISQTKVLIGFDMDGVIIDQALPKIHLAKKYGFTINPNQTPTEIIENILPADLWEKIQHYLYHDPEFALSTPLMHGARSVLQILQQNKIPYVLISRRKNHLLAAQLLEKHGLWPKFFNKKNAFFVAKPEDKNTQAIELGVTHYIDDECKVLEKLTNVPNRYLFDRFQVFKDTDFYKRISSWEELSFLIPFTENDNK